MAATTTTTRTTTNRHYSHQRNELGCLGSGPGGAYARLWRLFSVAAFRRRIIESVRCGGIGGVDADEEEEDDFLHAFQPTAAANPQPTKLTTAAAVSKYKPDVGWCGSTGKLSDLLNLPSCRESFSLPADVIVAAAAVDPVRQISSGSTAAEKVEAGSGEVVENEMFSKAENEEAGVKEVGKLDETENEEIAAIKKVGRLDEAENEEIAAAETGTVDDKTENGDEEGVAAAAAEKRKAEKYEEMSKAVRLLLQTKKKEKDDDEDKLSGAKLVRRLAKDDSEARCALAEMGAIPPLVEMLEVDDEDNNEEDDNDDGFRIEEALYALLNLGIGNDLNKAAIVEAGAIEKMMKLTTTSTSTPTPLSEAIVANFLALSAVDSNKPLLSPSIPFLTRTLQSPSLTTQQPKHDSLRALYNLTIHQTNIPILLTTAPTLIPYLLATLTTNPDLSDRNLSILTNMVTTLDGRKSIAAVPDSLPTLVDVLGWVDSPACQEKSSYVLMVMAHKSYRDRQAMVEAGIASVLLELMLIGSTLAQKRAARILDLLRLDKGKRVVVGLTASTLSAPICRGGGAGSGGGCSSSSAGSSSPISGQFWDKEVVAVVSEENQAVKDLVQQSLQSNMRKIVKRANLPTATAEEEEEEEEEQEREREHEQKQEEMFVPSQHLKSLTTSSTSKSLPF